MRLRKPRRRFAASAVFVLALLGATRVARAQPAEAVDAGRASLRIFGLAVHLTEQRRSAPLIPLKLDSAARLVPMPGILGAFDASPPWAWTSALRLEGAFYLDCALQPSGFVAVMPMFHSVGSQRWRFTAGVGLGAMARRSWKRHVTPGEPNPVLRDLGPVEAIAAPYAELELRFRPDERREFVLVLTPTWPAAVLSFGVRWLASDARGRDARIAVSQDDR